MSDWQIIQKTLEQTARRQRWQRSWRGGWQGTLVGALLFLLAISLYKLFPIPFQVVSWAGGLALACLFFGWLRGWLRPPSLSETARWIDSREQLQERLSTALELGRTDKLDQWKQLVLRDAAASAQKLDPRAMLPLQLPKATRWALLALVLSVGLGFVPEYRSKNYLEKKYQDQAIRDSGKQLAEFTRRNLETHKPVLEATRKNLESVGDLGEQLSKAPLTRSAALQELSSAADRLKQQLKEMGKNPSLKPLDRAARQGSRSGSSSASAAELQKKMEALEKTLGGNKEGNAEALDKLKNDLEKARQAGAQMPSAGTPEGDAARQQMAQNLADLARQSRELGQSLPSLEEAIAALQANQTERFLRDLETATNDLDKLQQMAKALQQMQQQAAQKGKDLAEQLKNGQAEMAQQTLRKMTEALQSKQLTGEPLEKMLKELTDAEKPAGDYGKVAEFLKEGVKQMKQGNKGQAGENLAKAAEELARMTQQMADAQSLMATLDALNKAEMAIVNGEGFGQGQGKGRGKMGKGGTPGSGVGTWADENNWMYYPNYTERYENGDMDTRAKMDSRSNTDRGDGELADTIQPTKLRGQITPGGPMPSITLKGVSIKGQSTVGYQEAVQAAQSEAQSAINQDQVPRAYQGGVKDYFNDLKK